MALPRRFKQTNCRGDRDIQALGHAELWNGHQLVTGFAREAPEAAVLGAEDQGHADAEVRLLNRLRRIRRPTRKLA